MNPQSILNRSQELMRMKSRLRDIAAEFKIIELKDSSSAMSHALNIRAYAIEDIAARLEKMAIKEARKQNVGLIKF